MAILHGREPRAPLPPPLRPLPLWDGRVAWHCSTCGTTGRPDHTPGGAECVLLADERAAQVRS